VSARHAKSRLYPWEPGDVVIVAARPRRAVRDFPAVGTEARVIASQYRTTIIEPDNRGGMWWGCEPWFLRSALTGRRARKPLPLVGADLVRSASTPFVKTLVRLNAVIGRLERLV
jgi:hypothetical protein